MSGGAPFDVGDLVVCVEPDLMPGGRRAMAEPGQHFHVGWMFPPEALADQHGRDVNSWGFLAGGDCVFRLSVGNGWVLARDCNRYRKVERKPQAFWTGEYEEGLRQAEPQRAFYGVGMLVGVIALLGSPLQAVERRDILGPVPASNGLPAGSIPARRASFQQVPA